VLPPNPGSGGRGTLPLAWFALSFAFLAAGAVQLLTVFPALAEHHAHPHTAALVHLWVLGFLLSVCFGSVYQMLPVVLGVPLRGSSLAWVHLGLHGLGVAGMVPSLHLGRYLGVFHAGLLVAAGGLVFTGLVAWVVLGLRKRDVVAWSFLLSALWLLLTMALGLLLAWNRHHASVPINQGAWLKAHAHVGIAGFFLTLLQGVSFRLVPMFTLGVVRSWPQVGHALWMSQLGLLGLAPSLATEWWLGQFGFGLLLAGGVLCSGIELLACLEQRRKRVIESGVRAFLGGAAIFALVACSGVLLALRGGLYDEDWVGRAATAYGLTVLLGGLLTMIAGMLLKIVPFIVWMRVYGPLYGRRSVPLAAQLPSARLDQAWLCLHIAAVAVLSVGAFKSSAGYLQAGAWLEGAGVVTFLANMAVISRHVFKPSPSS